MGKLYWHIKEINNDKVMKIANEFKLPNSIARIMALRGINSRKIISNFFYPSKNKIHDPFLLKDMDKAINRIISQREKKKKILIFGDYDVDGVSAASMLYLFFKDINVDVSYYIPHRDIDGYGLSKRGVDFSSEIGADLIITCDCGINAFEEISYAKQKDIDVIITDHHKPEEKIPHCIAVVNPNRKDCEYPFKGLCGAGVAFKLAMAISDSLSIDPKIAWSYADLITLGIAADIVPMIDENRVISHFGLEQIRSGNNMGLSSLIKTSNIDIKNISIGQLLFWVNPKINAAGRLGEASRAVKLLTSYNPVNTVEISKSLDRENEKRKLITLNMENESISMVNNNLDVKNIRSIVLYKEGWHPGIIGIVASRIKELYNRPTIIIALNKGIGKGSCRSIPQFDIVDGLHSCSKYLSGFGGHPMAAGLTINEKSIDVFINKFEKICSSSLGNEDIIPSIMIDLEINMTDINARLIKFLRYLEPYGPKNPKPKFITKNIFVEGKPRILGKDQSTIKFQVKQKNSLYEAIGFKMIEHYEKLIKGNPLDIVYHLSENNWNGKTSLQLEIKGIRYSSED